MQYEQIMNICFLMKCLEYFLSIEHGSEINIFDIRRGKIDRLNGGIRGVPRRSPFVRTDCTLKQKDSLYVVGALKGAADMSLYKSDPNTGKWIGLGPIPENTIKVGIDKCSQFKDTWDGPRENNGRLITSLNLPQP